MQRNPKSSGSHPVRSGAVPATPLRILVCSVLAVLAAGCQTQAPPARPEMQKQALQSLELPSAWKAGGEARPVADYWLATFGDAQLDALVAEAIAKNPDLRVTATKVEQAGQYVEMAKAALRPALNLFGTGGTNMGGGDALQLISLGNIVGNRPVGTPALRPQCRRGNLRLDPGRLRVRTPVSRRNDRQELVHRQ
jgi:hypothetical protein